ncbi:MAG: hypothetical protein GWN39_08920 [Thermoplasmata archaeon]|nr:hypothetical protein [Thermoplasmata archaeon]NIT76509.1 hypothetical protein [Thermoplasmata archaeon]NIV78859.1 hypothetical protein [Thermoplasmata archaeon]NIY02880.1 hypothetical protein [Thermoplasmata archaeon]
MFNDVVHEVTAFDGDLDTCATWSYVLELGPVVMDGLVEVIAYDHVGNVDTAEVGIIYDIVPPKIQLAQVETFSESPNLYLHGTVNEDGIDRIEVNGGLYPIDDKRVFSIVLTLKVGYNEITLSAQDRAGNRGKESFVIYHKEYAPYIDVEGVERLGEDRYLIYGRCSDVGTIEIDGTEYPVTDSVFRARIDVAPGTDRVKLKVEDPTGKTTTTTVDLEARRETSAFYPVLLVATIITLLVVIVVYIRSVRKDQEA